MIMMHIMKTPMVSWRFHSKRLALVRAGLSFLKYTILYNVYTDCCVIIRIQKNDEKESNYEAKHKNQLLQGNL